MATLKSQAGYWVLDRIDNDEPLMLNEFKRFMIGNGWNAAKVNAFMKTYGPVMKAKYAQLRMRAKRERIIARRMGW